MEEELNHRMDRKFFDGGLNESRLTVPTAVY